MVLDFKHFRKIFEKAPLGIFLTSREGRFIDLNERLAGILGYESVEEVKKLVKNIGTDLYLNLQDREDILKQVKDNNGIAVKEVRFKKKDGQVIFVRLSISIYSDAAKHKNKYIGMVEDISEVIDLQKRLKERENLLTSIVNCLPFELWAFDRKGNFLAQSGYSKKKWGNYVGRSRKDFPLIIDNNYDNDEYFDRVLTGESIDFTAPVNFNKKTFYTRRFLAPLKDEEKVLGVICISLDLTDKIMAQNRAIEIQKFLETVINGIPVRVFWKNIDLQFMGANAAFLKDLNVKSEIDIHGKTDYDFLSTRQANFSKKIYQEVIRTKKPILNFKMWLKHPEKEKSYILASAIPYFSKSGNNVEGVLGCYQDITLMKQMEEELIMHRNNLENMVDERMKQINQLNEELLASNEELHVLNEALSKQKHELEDTLKQLKNTQEQLVQSEKMASLGVITAGIAHEINNPLNFINSGMHGLEFVIKDIDQLAKGMLAELEGEQSERGNTLQSLINDMDELLNSMSSGVARTTNIVKGLRIFSRMDTEEKSAADIHELIEVALVILKNSYKNRIEIRRNLATLPKIRCFPGKLSQVFVNILMNAIQSIDNNGTIEISTNVIKKGKFVEIIISDDGCGIPEQIKHKIFDPFFTTKAVNEGTGMGLSIVHSIISDHEGNISFESITGKGTKFRITLPV